MEPLNVLTPESAPMTATLAIDGMTCGGCAAKVRRTLTALPGVVAATVELATHRATVGYDPALVSLESITHAVAALEYDVRPV
ncbi:MAG TPA: heavy metal-associated domain-containing protein [Stenomitos sp.]